MHLVSSVRHTFIFARLIDSYIADRLKMVLYLSPIYLSIYLSIYIIICLSIHPSICHELLLSKLLYVYLYYYIGDATRAAILQVQKAFQLEDQ